MDGMSRELIKAPPLRKMGSSCSRRETSAVPDLIPVLELPPRPRAGKKWWILLDGCREDQGEWKKKFIPCFYLREIKICILGKQPSEGLMNRQYTGRGVALFQSRSGRSFSLHREQS